MKFSSIKTLVLLLAVFTFFSCKKNSDSSYYVKLKINGTWVTWTSAAGELGPDLANPAKTDLGVIANDAAMKDVFDISIQVDGADFPTGSYASDNPNILVYVSYFKDANTAAAKFFDIDNAPGRPDSKYIVTLTSITATELRGNFTGNYLYNDFDGESLDITEGEFVVRRVR